MSSVFKVALVGNPNSGKSSLFNALTGLNQKVGNFPGVTVDKKTGKCRLPDGKTIDIIDLPGTYSLYPKSADEFVTYEVLLNEQHRDYPDLVVVVADASNLKRNLLFCSQIMDLNIPVVMALTMVDLAKKKNITIDIEELQRQTGVPVVAINPRKQKGIGELRLLLSRLYSSPHYTGKKNFIATETLTGVWINELRTLTGVSSDYSALHIACNYTELSFLNAAQRMQIPLLCDLNNFQKSKIQGEEIMQRFGMINTIIARSVKQETMEERRSNAERWDKILLHPFWGNVTLLLILFLLFQSIFWLAEYPMDWMEFLFSRFSELLTTVMPENLFTDLIVNGLLAGISGIAIFIPQIMILFGFITILEDSGYMARISFLTDRLMRSTGLNGRSVMPLISGMACAVPAIMSARTIQNKKERLITIMVTPLMSCSARLPVYTILISLVVPDIKLLGVINIQGLFLMGLYLLGFVMALIVSKIMSAFIKVREKSYFLMELPVYRTPRWKNVITTMIEKAKIFVLDAGKVILIIALILWILSTFGPPKAMKSIDLRYTEQLQQHPEKQDELYRVMKSDKLAHSYAGHLGKMIEPAIRPLGYDWKIGIALITSFAAREVFVGTMATLYSVGDTQDQSDTVREKMRKAKLENGEPVYTVATSVSLLLFYVFAMQCMSTMAVVKRETGTWKYPLIQLAYMTAIAYLSALLAYQILK